MAYACPRCGSPVHRGRSRAAGFAGGIAGALIFAAFGSFQCQKCGKIPTNEFPPDVQTKARLNSVLMIGGAVLLIVVVVVLQMFLRS